MAIKNSISVTVTPEDEASVVQHVVDIRGILSFLVNLSLEERIRRAKLSRSKVDFLDVSLIEIKSKPELAPSYVKVDEFIKDMDVRGVLHRVKAEVDGLAERLEDTILLVESEAYRQARLFYKSVKAAAQEGGEDAQRIAKKLGYHFKKQGSTKHSGENTGDKGDADGNVDGNVDDTTDVKNKE
ncbi:MAG: hypothetical protein GY940_19885 [bacterium]|nr:hypothetical protein [bacterium]